jgi:hypothetical protein
MAAAILGMWSSERPSRAAVAPQNLRNFLLDMPFTSRAFTKFSLKRPFFNGSTFSPPFKSLFKYLVPLPH